MRRCVPIALLAVIALAVLTSCVTNRGATAQQSPDGAPAGQELAAREARASSGAEGSSSARETSPPPQLEKLNPPPKPSLSALKDRDRPSIEFFGAQIYADSIRGTKAKGHVFLDGTNLHKGNRSFPIAVYAEQMEVDVQRGKVTLSGWPIVQTDSAFVQAQSQDTTIFLNRDRMARIKGPASYVIGDHQEELFLP